MVQGTELGNLRMIRLREMNIDDSALFNLAKWKSLVTVDLYGTNVKGESLSALAALPGLQVLDLSKCPLVDAFEIDKLTQLRELELNTTGIGDKGLERVAALTKLRVLGLDHTRVTDDGLAHLKPLSSLETLRLAGTAVTDSGLKHLEALAALKHLYLDSTKVSEEAKIKLTMTRPSLTLHY